MLISIEFVGRNSTHALFVFFFNKARVANLLHFSATFRFDDYLWHFWVEANCKISPLELQRGSVGHKCCRINDVKIRTISEPFSLLFQKIFSEHGVFIFVSLHITQAQRRTSALCSRTLMCCRCVEHSCETLAVEQTALRYHEDSLDLCRHCCTARTMTRVTVSTSFSNGCSWLTAGMWTNSDRSHLANAQ